MVKRYLKAQGMVLLFGGLVGPIFLVVYFALGPMARPYLNWMFWSGLFITAVDVLAALALTNAGAKAAARHDELTRQGILVPARITGMSDTAWFVNDQQMIKVNLHFEVPGQPGFDAQETMASSPTRMQILNGHQLVALVEPGAVATELVGHMRPESQAGFQERFAGVELLEAADIADAIRYVVTRPRHMAVNEILIRPTEQQG